MAGERGVKVAPHLAVIDGAAVDKTASGKAFGKVAPPPGAKMDETQQEYWALYIAENPYLDVRDSMNAFVWVQMATRYVSDPRGFSASEVREMTSLAARLYLDAAERSRRVGGEAAPKAGAARSFLSKRKT